MKFVHKVHKDMANVYPQTTFSANRSRSGGNTTVCAFPKWQPPPSWIYPKVEYWATATLVWPLTNIYVQTTLGDFTFWFNFRSVRILDWAKRLSERLSLIQKVKSPIWCQWVKNWLRYTCLCISKMAVVRHLGFVILQFWTTHEVPLCLWPMA